MVHENFINIIGQQTEEFTHLFSLMQNSDKEKGEKFLCLVNHIMDFYIYRDHTSEVLMPIIHFPICADWAQRLCEEFVALKMSVCFGSQIKNKAEDYMRKNRHCIIPMGYSGNKALPYRNRWHFYNQLNKFYMSSVEIPSCEDEKNLIFSHYLYSSYNKIDSIDKFWYLKETLGDDTSITDTSEPLSILPYPKDKNNKSTYDEHLFEIISENDGKTKFPYIFLFLNKDMDGRNHPFCMSLQRETINEFNEDYDAGIKVVFFFQFSSKPYRLQRIFEFKHNLVERLQREKVAQTRDFISFTQEEMHLVFSRVSKKETTTIEYNRAKDSYDIKTIFDSIVQDYPRLAKMRNELALCYTDKAKEYFKEDALQIDSDCPTDQFDYFFGIMSSLVNQYAEEQIMDFVLCQRVKVIVDFNVDNKYKREFANYLKEIGAVSVSFGTFKDFKRLKDGRNYMNNIKEQKILVMSFLNHRTGQSFPIFPNSFDELYTHSYQSVLFVNNLFAFDPRYVWSEYRYIEQQRMILNSNFRSEYMKADIPKLRRPEIKEPREDEDELNNNRSQGSSALRYQILYDGTRQHRTVFESDPLICRYSIEGNEIEQAIYTADEILRLFEDKSILELVPVSDLYEVLKSWVATKTRDELAGEKAIRMNNKYGLTKEEQNSKIELWKILLKKKVQQEGLNKVYGDIMSPLQPFERIKISSVERWLDDDNDAILPRSRKMQKRVLEEYLGIDVYYTRIMRHRKSMASTKTENINKILRIFIMQSILSSNFERTYSCLSDEICDYLDISSAEDVKDYVNEILLPEISFRSIKDIKII